MSDKHSFYFNGSKTPVIAQPVTHTWRPHRGEHSWVMRLNNGLHSEFEEPGPIVERYTPPRSTKHPNAR